MHKLSSFFLSLLTVIFYLNSGAQPMPNDGKETRALNALPGTARAQLEAKSGSKIHGTIDFSETTKGVVVKYDLSGLKPGSTHGFHIHESGDCSSADAKSAGPHYKELTPTGGTSADFPGRYAGDLPEIEADKNGRARGEFEASTLSLNKKNPIVDRAVIVHGGPDDVTKKSAPRIACGVIKTTTK